MEDNNTTLNISDSGSDSDDLFLDIEPDEPGKAISDSVQIGTVEDNNTTLNISDSGSDSDDLFLDIEPDEPGKAISDSVQIGTVEDNNTTLNISDSGSDSDDLFLEPDEPEKAISDSVQIGTVEDNNTTLNISDSGSDSDDLFLEPDEPIPKDDADSVEIESMENAISIGDGDDDNNNNGFLFGTVPKAEQEDHPVPKLGGDDDDPFCDKEVRLQTMLVDDHDFEMMRIAMQSKTVYLLHPSQVCVANRRFGRNFRLRASNNLVPPPQIASMFDNGCNNKVGGQIVTSAKARHSAVLDTIQSALVETFPRFDVHMLFGSRDTMDQFKVAFSLTRKSCGEW